MITFLHQELENVVGFRLEETITAADIDILAERMKEKFDTEEYINLYIEIDENLSESFGGILEQAKKGFSVILPNLGKIRKAALISDKNWLRKITQFKDLFFTMEMKGFTSDEKHEALDWIKR